MILYNRYEHGACSTLWSPHRELAARQATAWEYPIKWTNPGYDRLRRPPMKRRRVRKAMLDELAKGGDGNGGHGRGRRRPSATGTTVLPAPDAEQREQTLYRIKPEHKKERPVP